MPPLSSRASRDWERPSMRLYKPTFARGFAIGLALVLLLAGLIGG